MLLSVKYCITDSFNIYSILTILYIFAITNIYKEKKQKLFMFFTFILSYFLIFFLILTNFIKIYSFLDYISPIVILLGLSSIIIAIDNIFYYNIKNNIKNEKIKVDVSIPLIFIIVALSLSLLSINILDIDYGLYNLLKVLHEENIVFKIIFSLIYILLFLSIFSLIIFILFALSNYFTKNKNLINGILFILIGILFIFFS